MEQTNQGQAGVRGKKCKQTEVMFFVCAAFSNEYHDIGLKKILCSTHKGTQGSYSDMRRWECFNKMYL